MATPNIYQIDAFDKLWCKCDGTTTSFVDSSTGQAAKDITANGNATQLPIKFNKSAGFFNGTTDYVNIAFSADWGVGTNDYSFETFVNFTTVQTCYIVDFETQVFAVRYASGHLYVYQAGNPRIDYTWTPTANTWYHIMVVRTSGATKLYVDAVQGGSTYNGADSLAGSTPWYIGRASNAASAYFAGWMKELRWCVDARTVAVPTTQYVTDATTRLLMHFDTPATSPLAPAIAFDGTGDYLSLADSDDWDFAAGEFNIQASAMITDTSTATARTIASHYAGAGHRGWWFFWNQPDNKLYFQYTTDGTTALTKSQSYTPTLNKWVHFRACRVVNTLYFYADGRLLGSDDFTGVTTHGGGTATCEVGSAIGGTNGLWIGYLREVVVQKGGGGTATAFTPSQTGFTVDANTKLYIKGDENNGVTTFVDSSTSPKTVTTAGDTKIKYTEDYRSCIFKDETGKFPYPVGSAKVDFFAIGSGVGYFDGTGDDLTVPDSDDWYFDGDFTLELYARWPAVANTKYLIGQNQNPAGVTDYWYWSWDATNGMYFAVKVGNSIIVSYAGGKVIPLVANTWFHLAIRRASNEYQCFMNGVAGTAATDTSAMSNYTGTLNIGSADHVTFMEAGLLDNIRISKGVARYTASFNPPQFPVRNFGGFIAFM